MTEQEKDDAFDYALNEIAKNALMKLQMDTEDERYVFLVGFLLIHISELNSDEYLVKSAMRHLEHRHFEIPEEEVREIVLKTRANCDRQQFALEFAFEQIENDNLSGEEVCNNLSHFLSKSV